MPADRRACCALCLALVACLALRPPPGRTDEARAGEVEKLIEQLGDADLAKRKAAMKQLEALGEEALPALRKAGKEHADVDVRLRALVVVAAIDKKLRGELRVFEGHRGWVYRVVLSPDGKQAVSSGDALRVWDVESGKAVRSFGAGQGGWGLSTSRDGKRVLCSAADRSVRLWDVETGKEVQRFAGQHFNEVWVAALSPDGKRAITGGMDRRLLEWDVATGKLLRAFEGATDMARCSAWSPDGKQLAVGHYNSIDFVNSQGTVRIWDVKTGKQVRAFPGHVGAITAVAFSPDGKQLASSSFDKTVRIWGVASGKEVQRFTHPGPSDAVAFVPGGRRVVTTGWGADHTVRVWDVRSGKEERRYEGHTAGALCVAVSPDGRRALSGGQDGTLRLWPLPK